MKFRTIHLVLLSLLSGLILSLGWPERGIPVLLFAGMVPMLMVEDLIFKNRDSHIRFSVLLFSYPGFFLWNLLTTWWIVNSTFVGALLAIVLNALFMSVIFQAFHWTRKKLNHPAAAYASLAAYWISLEYLHLNWDLNWPWLNLGNGFATWYHWVQWYEFTGALGGSLWILIANFLIFIIFNKWFSKKFNSAGIKVTTSGNTEPGPGNQKGTTQTSTISKKNRKSFIINRLTVITTLWILLPVLLSYLIYFSYKEQHNPVNFVVVQPNVDPYSEQYVIPPPQVIGKIRKLALEKLDSTTNFLIAPESAIQESMWENDLSSFASISLLKKWFENWPELNIIIGGSTFYQLMPGEPLPRWARKFTDTDNHYVAYNAAILINNRDSLQLYHKSKLTPGVEILPSFSGFKWLENYAIDLGGTVGSLGMDSVRKVYKTVKTVPIGPVICYESIFGEFFSEFVKNGARVMVIITNDGWWGRTAGHRQHFSFAHLRAIETRRSIARSANTGISGFIDQRGDASQTTKYWVPDVIKGSLNANSELTFYVRHGDYIARFLSYLAGLLFLAAILTSLRQRFFRKKLH